MTAQHIRFVKATGAGNDFVVLDDRNGSVPADRASLARVLCDRQFGVGGDGMLVLTPSATAGFRMEYYNADGSSGGMCGNGGRVMARFAVAEGAAAARCTFEAVGSVYHAEVTGDTVLLRLPDCPGPWPKVSVRLADRSVSGFRINTGAPHFVAFVDDLDALDVQRIGAQICAHEAFAPDETNVDFVALLHEKALRLRTYERGVARETLACGTGSVAAAIIAAWRGKVRAPVSVGVRSGEELRVGFVASADAAREITLEGSARLLFSGTVLYEARTGTIRRGHDRIQEASAT